MFAFGSGEKVVGRTRYCTLPPRLVRRAEVVGGTKKVDVEKVLNLRPDLVVAVKEENTREDVERLREAGLEVFVGEPEKVASAAAVLRELARLVEAPDTSSVERTEKVLKRLENLPGRPRRTFAPIWKKPLMTPGGDTYVSDVLKVSGGENVFADRARYPAVAPEEVEERAPEVVLLPDEPYEFSAVDLEDFYSLSIPAAKEGRIHLVSGKLLTWYGPRMADSLTQLSALLRF